MEEINFLIDTTMGEVDVTLYADGWASFSFTEETEDPTLVEEFVRGPAEVQSGLQTLGLTDDEAEELAEELWEELDETEQAERSRQPGD